MSCSKLIAGSWNSLHPVHFANEVPKRNAQRARRTHQRNAGPSDALAIRWELDARISQDRRKQDLIANEAARSLVWIDPWPDLARAHRSDLHRVLDLGQTMYFRHAEPAV